MELQRHSFYFWLAWSLIKKNGKIITSPRARRLARESSNSPPLSSKNNKNFYYIFAFLYDANHIDGQPNFFFYCILLQEIAYWNVNFIEFLQGLLRLQTTVSTDNYHRLRNCNRRIIYEPCFTFCFCCENNRQRRTDVRIFKCPCCILWFRYSRNICSATQK
jgi:hypothetical protein